MSRAADNTQATGPALTSLVSGTALPWNQPGFEGYDLLPVSSSAPSKYTLTAAPLPGELPRGEVGPAVLIVYLPEGAKLWVEDRGIPLQGQTSYFRSPPLNPGKQYDYTVRAAWPEDGHLVSETRDVTVEAGLIQALYLKPTQTYLVQKKQARIEAALAKLSSEDQKAARQQQMCVILKDVPLGERGVPVKVMLNKQGVFVCSEHCVKQAQADPKTALARAEALRAKNAVPKGNDKDK